MISPKMLFILLVLIYVGPSHEENPEKETKETKSFSLNEATLKLKKLVNETLNKIKDYGQEMKEKLKEWVNHNGKGGNVDEDIKDLEVILKSSISNDFKEKENNINQQLLNLTKSQKTDINEKFEKFYDDAKSLLTDAHIYWKNQWNAATNLFKSGV